MRRTLRRCGNFPGGMSAIMLSLLAISTAMAQAPSSSNPLRREAAARNAAPAASTSTSSAPVGTAVRQAGGSQAASQAGSSSVASRSSSGPDRAQRYRAAAASREAVNRPASAPAAAVEQAAYRRRTAGTPANWRQPPSEAVPPSTSSVLNGTVTVEPGTVEIVGEELPYDDFGGPPGMGDGCCDDNQCGQCCLVICPRFPCDDITIFGGAQGFTGPKNRGETASFGFHEGVNWGAPLPCMNGCLAMQLGARLTQSNLSAAEFTSDGREQLFVTGGFFRRVDWGLQGGVVLDYLSDDWYTNTDLTQIRGEVEWVFPCGHELGFWMTASLSDDTASGLVFTTPAAAAIVTQTWEAADLYAVFYRHQFTDWEGSHGRIYAGFSGNGDGLIGADAHVPLACNLALEAGFAYLVPEETEGVAGPGNEEESWNVGISLVWYPGKGTAAGKSYFAPLFNVADNGSFMVDHVP